MTYVVIDSCIKCKYTDCVDVCPVDCFKEGPNMLVIDPDECIDCTNCEPACPWKAIFEQDEVPGVFGASVDQNAALADNITVRGSAWLGRVIQNLSRPLIQALACGLRGH